MSLEGKFLAHNRLHAGRGQRLWIGGALLAWAVLLLAIANMMLQTDGQIAEGQGDKLNQIIPAAGPNE
jgi:hypothetical protein